MNSKHGILSILFLKSVDLILLLVALGSTIALIYAPESHMGIPDYSVDFLSTRVKLSNAILCGVLLLIWHWCFKVQGLYFSQRLSDIKELVWRLSMAIGSSAVALFIVAQIVSWKTVILKAAAVFFLLCSGFVG